MRFAWEASDSVHSSPRGTQKGSPRLPLQSEAGPIFTGTTLGRRLRVGETEKETIAQKHSQTSPFIFKDRS